MVGKLHVKVISWETQSRDFTDAPDRRTKRQHEATTPIAASVKCIFFYDILLHIIHMYTVCVVIYA